MADVIEHAVFRLSDIALFEEKEREETPKEEKPLTEKERANLLNIIGALLEIHATKDAALINEIIERFPSTPGLKERNLQAKFAAARRSLRSS